MSDVPQLNCSIENEVAQNATKNFAQMLEKAFEQYKKLWNEYLKLWKHCENANINIPFQFPESENHNNTVVGLSLQTLASSAKPSNEHKSHTLSGNTGITLPVHQNTSNACDSDITTNSDDIVLNSTKFAVMQMEADLLKSPILIKKRSRLKKTGIPHRHSILDDSDENNVSMKESVLTNSQEDIAKVSVELKENGGCSFMENNSDQIECTPISKMPKKLGISNLYNVDTTLLPNGKKLKQLQLVLFPHEEKANCTIPRKHKEVKSLKVHVSSTPEKNINRKSGNVCRAKSIDEEIIESSPDKQTESSLKIKSLKLKKKSPAKLTEKNVSEKINIQGSFDNKNSDAKQLLKETNRSSLSQYSPPPFTSTQIHQSNLIEQTKAFSFSHDENIDCDILSSSSALVDIDILCSESDKDPSPVKETNKFGTTENDSQAQKRKFPKSISQGLNQNSSTCNDDTFFTLEENFKERPVHDIFKLKDATENMYKNKILASPPAKKSLMSRFDILPEKKVTVTHKPSKSKLERAKMTGVSCWECKQYYGNLGLSEKEIKARKNHCSRHRTNQKERESTPEGFWNPLFPDTFTSTFQED